MVDNIKISFNPRAHAGRDLCRKSLFFFIKVSIHAPTRGATCDGIRLCCHRAGFNPRAHAGRDITAPTAG